MKEKITRREAMSEMLKWGAVAYGAGFLPFGFNIEKAQASSVSPKVTVAKGGNIYGRLKEVLKNSGGIEKFVNKGSRVIIKPNVGWARNPEDAANTNPDLVYYIIKMCYSAGAKEVKVFEYTCDNYVYCFQKSGIKDAVERAGGEIYSADSQKYYKNMKIPGAKTLKNVDVVKYVTEADCFINVPVAKNHSAAILTLGMKNMMGIIFDRGFWHNAGLDQCIAEFMTIVKPHLTIIDATRILTTGGPKGPGKVKELNTLIGSTDFVAADAYAATLFGMKGMDIPYIKLAHNMGLGQADTSKMSIVNV